MGFGQHFETSLMDFKVSINHMFCEFVLVFLGECDFEGGLCDWKIIDTGLYAWKRQLARTAPSTVAPSDDHTTGSEDGYYMYVDSTQGTFGLSAVFQSPDLLGNTGLR